MQTITDRSSNDLHVLSGSEFDSELNTNTVRISHMPMS